MAARAPLCGVANRMFPATLGSPRTSNSRHRRTAPYQLSPPLTVKWRITVADSRTGEAHQASRFDANVNLQFVGQPQNVQVENKPINKDKPDETYASSFGQRPVGTYTMLSGRPGASVVPPQSAEV